MLLLQTVCNMYIIFEKNNNSELIDLELLVFQNSVTGPFSLKLENIKSFVYKINAFYAECK